MSKEHYAGLKNNTHNLKLGPFESKQQRDEAIFQVYMLHHELLTEDLTEFHLCPLSKVSLLQKALEAGNLKLSTTRLTGIIRRKMRMAMRVKRIMEAK